PTEERQRGRSAMEISGRSGGQDPMGAGTLFDYLSAARRTAALEAQDSPSGWSTPAAPSEAYRPAPARPPERPTEQKPDDEREQPEQESEPEATIESIEAVTEAAAEPVAGRAEPVL